MNRSVLWLCSGSPAVVASVKEQLQSDGYLLLHPDPLVPVWQLPAANFALIEWVGDGKEASQQVRSLRQHQPACYLLLLLPKERSAVLEAVRLAVTGYLAVPFCPTELVGYLNSIGQGNGYWNSDLLMLLTGRLSVERTYPTGLNQREHELWDHLADGLTNQHIEAQMCLSGSRVKNLKTILAQKLELPNAHHLIERAVQWGKDTDQISHL